MPHNRTADALAVASLAEGAGDDEGKSPLLMEDVYVVGQEPPPH